MFLAVENPRQSVIYIYFLRYITHMLEKACQYDESEMTETELKFESSLSVQSTRTTGVVAELAVVKSDVIELSMEMAEEKDGRINVEYVYL